MKKILTFLVILLASTSLLAQEYHFLARALKDQGEVQVFREGVKFMYDLELGPEHLRTIETLSGDDEVFISGHMEERRTESSDGIRYESIFIVDSLKPISLRRLQSPSFEVPDKRNEYVSHPLERPWTLNVSSALATAITMSVSGVLLSQLTMNANGGNFRNQLNGLVIIGAGFLMTGSLFFDDYFTSSPKQ